MRDYVVHGKSKKEFKLLMPLFEGMPEHLGKTMCGYDVGDTIYAYLDKESEPFGDRKDHVYEVSVNYKKIKLTRSELEDLLDIHFETRSYNSCIKNGISCNRLIGVCEGKTERDEIDFLSSCRIHWDIGRGSCSGYQVD
jgi:hypothetical protein